jgi:hypothetical protein
MKDSARKAMFAKSKSNHIHNLKGYWGGWYCATPNCTVKKYQQLQPDSDWNKQIGYKFDNIRKSKVN